jgi:glycosyltransferase involved in cell wall biosynthesis
VSGIAVVIPTYNRADFIEATVESVLAQTLKPTQVIVVDDGSTDSTAEVCSRLPRSVTYIRAENKGVSAARNRGIAASTAEWIAFCDSDDLWHPEKLELQRAAMDATQADWSITDFGIIDPDTKTIAANGGIARTFVTFSDGALMPAAHFAHWLRRSQVRAGTLSAEVFSGDAFGMLFLGNVALTSTSIVARELIERAGPFDESLRVAEDTEFFHRIAALANVAIVMCPLTKYRVGHAALTRGDQIPYIEHTLCSVNSAALRRTPLSSEERNAFRAGRKALRLRLAYSRLSSLDTAGARDAVRAAWREDDVRSIGSLAIAVLSFLPPAALDGLHRGKKLLRAFSG